MGLEAKLVQRLSQQLLMTPQLQQAIKLLQLGRLEYIEAIERELLDNPVLEMASEDESLSSSPPDVPGSEEPLTVPRTGDDLSESSMQSAEGNTSTAEVEPNNSPVDWNDYLESFSDVRGSASPKGLVDFEDRPSVENAASRAESLSDHLISQLRMLDLSAKEAEIAYYIVGNLNRDGYLCVNYSEIAEACQSDVDSVAKVASQIQYLDPPGAACSTLGECLAIQLEELGYAESLAAKIVHNHLDKVEKRAYEKIAKAEGCVVEDVYKAVQQIQQLEPRPGRQFGDDETRYITPDIYVQKVGAEYVITLNEDGLPKLRISPYYMELLGKEAADGSQNKAYLNERLKAATWIIKSIHQRQRTIYRVTESIVKFQRDFFDYGISRLKPMVLKDVADDIGMHESTVSRVTTAKYVHTSHGVFELKFFFTTGIRHDGGDDVSSSSVKERIRALIAAETPNDPISDQQIVDLLKNEKVEIARRTVAKYRESLGILPSSKRKKMF
jgi:RNA polymerase sigma-54 factor